MATACNGHTTTPEPQISTFTDALPESSRFAVAARHTPFVYWLALQSGFNQPSDLFAVRQQFPSIRRLTIHQTLSSNHWDEVGHPLAVRVVASVPAIFKLAGIFWEVFGRDAMPASVNSSF